MDYSLLQSLGDDAQPVAQIERTRSSKAEKRLQRQAQRSAEREQAERQQAEAAAAEQAAAAEAERAFNLRTVKPGKDSAASFLLPPSDVSADKAGAFVETLVLERQAREQRQAQARLAYGQQLPARAPPCHHYQRGRCVFGASCKYSHDVPQILMAQSDAPPAAAAAFARLGHVRTGSGGSSSAGGGGSSSTSRPRADGLSQEQLAGVRAANTQDPALSREALQRLGKRPEEMPFYKTVMCNFYKHQGFCPRGDSCTFAHGEADKRPQYRGDDVRRTTPRPAHYLQPQQQQPQQPVQQHKQLQQQQSVAADPAELMRQVAAASGRASAGSAGQRLRPYRPYSPPMVPGARPVPPAQLQQQQYQQPDAPPEFQLPSQPWGGSAPRPASSQDAQGRQQQQQQRQQQRQQPLTRRAQHLHQQHSRTQQSGFAQQSAFGPLATSDADRSEKGFDSSSEHSEASSAAAPETAQNGGANAAGLAIVMTELHIDPEEDLDEEELLRDPVVAADGHTYEREVIEQWLEKNVTSPLTGLQLRHGTLLENTAVKNAIAAMKA